MYTLQQFRLARSARALSIQNNTDPIAALMFVVVLSLCSSTASVAVVPFVPFGTSAGDAMLSGGADDNAFGPFPLPLPMSFPLGPAQTSYYLSSNGLVSFTAVSTYGDLVIPSSTSNGGIYYRSVSGNTSQLEFVWRDVISSIPFAPSHALVFTVDRCVFFRDSNSIVTSQTIILWGSTQTLMIFRIRAVQRPYLVFSGYVGPEGSRVQSDDSTLWPNVTNVGVPGVVSVLFATASGSFTTSSSLSFPSGSHEGSLTSSFHASSSHTWSSGWSVSLTETSTFFKNVVVVVFYNNHCGHLVFSRNSHHIGHQNADLFVVRNCFHISVPSHAIVDSVVSRIHQRCDFT
ncbi:transmembrane protein, putative [Bodo saltans]|uniref:Transmembrane protein, putative n=1 Tax=Bodo saltans TaxID=75058 RepID=A0A0S4IZ04_BODSA|nr:transmembrane protein, putative [Bodo saltans]|eukprot:CUG20445.1 transmembrane protein, putative [Bodo saltans]